MNRKIELLLQVAADFDDFCKADASMNAFSNDELSENELDLLAAAVSNPTLNNKLLSGKE